MNNLKGIVNFNKEIPYVDLSEGKETLTLKINNNTYIITYIGNLYNCDDLKKELKEFGFYFETKKEAEVILKGYIHFGYKILNKMNGIFAFAIWNLNAKKLFLARDHFGVKPLYYTISNGNLIFANNIQTILEETKIEPIIDSTGMCELLGLGPAHTPGTTIFKNINEIRPAHFAIYTNGGLYIDKYWELESKPHTDNFEDTCKKIKFLIEDAVKKQFLCGKPACTLLSGGLDSSIITAYASNLAQKYNLPTLNTYSVDYIDNDKNFVKNDFQPNTDDYYIDIMVNKYKTNHHKIYIDTPELADSLKDAVYAREFPGMADVDSSLYLFCKEISKDFNITLSGECADEVFGGYPWFFREEMLNSNTFPWSNAFNERQSLLNPELSKKINLKEYVDNRYNESINEINLLDTDSFETAQKRKIFYLNFNWFMQTLIDRSERIGSANNLDIRTPFSDYRLVEYLWNIPWETKSMGNREKGLLRYIMKDILPEEIVERKKSPYPKTYNPTYLEKVKNMLTEIVENNNSPIKSILNIEYINEILETNGTNFTKPWFGQLMTGPQFMAYLCQINMWLEKYQPKIEI